MPRAGPRNAAGSHVVAEKRKLREITPEMIEVGARVLYDLDGEVSKETLARLVFGAMVELTKCVQDESGDRPKE
jgi:hypothetical protein